LLPCRYPFKWSIPWITKYFKNFFSLISNSGASFLITSLQRRISPTLREYGKASTLVGLSFLRYFLFSSCDLRGETNAIEREYFFPRMAFLIRVCVFVNAIRILFYF